MKRFALLIALAGAWSAAPAGGQVTQPQLRQFTERALRNEWFDSIPPHFFWDEDPMMYSLGMVFLPGEDGGFAVPVDGEAPAVGREEPLHAAVREQFTVTLIRTHRNAPAQQPFWRPLLARVEREIATMLHVAQDARRPIEQRAETVRAASRRIDALYQRELDALARRHGKQGAEQRVVVAAPGYHVVLRTEPAGGAIAHMPQGFWELAAFLRKNGQPDYPDPPWEHVADPDFVLLGGRNLFQVT